MSNPWGMSPEVVAALEARVARPVLLAWFDHIPSPARYAAHSRSLYWDHDGSGTAHEFVGAGAFAQVSQASATGTAAPVEMTFTLSMLDQQALADALSARWRGRECALWVALVHESGGIIGQPLLRFRGRMSRQPIAMGDVSAISVVAVSRATDWRRPLRRYRTNADRQARYPGDRFYEFAAQTAERELTWGRK